MNKLSMRDDYTRWTVVHLLEEQAKHRPEQICLETVDGRRCTYFQMWTEVCRLASGLRLHGVAPVETIIILADNSYEAVQAWLAVNTAGAIEVTINTAYRGALLIHAIRTASARTIIIDEKYLSELILVSKDLPDLVNVIVCGETATKQDGWNVLLLSDLRSDLSEPWRHDARHHNLASIIYTSGTSGPAKGVLLTHAQNYLAAMTAVRGLHLNAHDIYYCAHPLFHQAGKFLAAQAIFMAGGKLFLDRSFAASSWIETISHSRATVTVAHGPMLEMIHAQPQSAADAATAITRILACPLPKRIAESFESRFKVKVIEGYGMTEIGVPCWRPYNEPLKVGSCGKLLADLFDLRICDPDTDEPLPDNTVGEILVRPLLPWTLMQGYIGMPDRTVEAWRNLWFHTGDAAYRDSDGYYFYVDRLKDRIRRRAESISSYDIEVAALSYPHIVDCAAVGIPSEYENDDDIKLCVVSKSTAIELDPLELTRHLLAALPHFMVPRYIEVVDALPRTPTNKVKRALLRESGVTPRTWDRKAAGVSLQGLARRVEVAEEG